MSTDVAALIRAEALLRALAASDVPLGASTVAQLAGVARNTAFRTLRTLSRLGWVESVGTPPRYRAGSRFSATADKVLTLAAHPPLRRLAAATGETVYLAVCDGEQSRNVQVIEGRGLLRVSGALGQGFPLHASAPGKVFLAFVPGLCERISARPLSRLTPATITTAEALRLEVRRVRQQGWALNREELARGLSGLAFPILDGESTCIAALGVLVPVAVCPTKSMASRFGQPLISAAEEISRALGRRANPQG